MGERFAVLAAGGFPYLVAASDTGIAGYAYAGPYRTRVAYRNTVEDSVYLGPQFHRRGIGRALLDRLVSESEARGYRQMVAVIGDSAQAGSIALHRAAGFRMVGTLAAVGHKFGRWIDTVLMQRALGPGATTQP
jgi:L-amino acid N-acyltransferase YncA